MEPDCLLSPHMRTIVYLSWILPHPPKFGHTFPVSVQPAYCEAPVGYRSHLPRSRVSQGCASWRMGGKSLVCGESRVRKHFPQAFRVLAHIVEFRDYNLGVSACALQSHFYFLLKPAYLPVECKSFGQTYRLLFWLRGLKMAMVVSKSVRWFWSMLMLKNTNISGRVCTQSY